MTRAGPISCSFSLDPPNTVAAAAIIGRASWVEVDLMRIVVRPGMKLGAPGNSLAPIG